MLIQSQSKLLNGMLKALSTTIVMTTVLCLYIAFQYFDSQNITTQQERLLYSFGPTETQVSRQYTEAAKIHSFH